VAYPSGNTQNGGLRYYNQGDGKFYHVGANGEIEPLSDQQFYRVSKVTWAPNTNKAVLEYPDQTKIVYNFDTKKQVTLPKHWEDFSFSSDGNEIAAKSMTLSPENRALIISKDDGTGERAIQELGSYADRVTVDWSPSRQTVALSQTGDPVGGERRQVLLVGQNQENFKPITTEGLNFQSNWSPSGQHLLYSVDSSRTDYKPELWITESYGDRIDANRRSLEINTWAEKCSFADESTLYCAVPRDLPSGAGVLPEASTYPTDDIYRIDTKTGARVAIPLDGENRRIKSLNFDKRNNKLFFTEQDNLGLFEVKL
jgi:dipeptidyl aminopeptidase/acylaminoacyl peptidase